MVTAWINGLFGIIWPQNLVSKMLQNLILRVDAHGTLNTGAFRKLGSLW